MDYLPEVVIKDFSLHMTVYSEVYREQRNLVLNDLMKTCTYFIVKKHS
jgi:hypothetical protein